MAKGKNGAHRDPGALDTSTKVNRDLIAKANLVARKKGKTLYDYIDGILRPVVERDYYVIFPDEKP